MASSKKKKSSSKKQPAQKRVPQRSRSRGKKEATVVTNYVSWKTYENGEIRYFDEHKIRIGKDEGEARRKEIEDRLLKEFEVAFKLAQYIESELNRSEWPRKYHQRLQKAGNDLKAVLDSSLVTKSFLPVISDLEALEQDMQQQMTRIAVPAVEASAPSRTRAKKQQVTAAVRPTVPETDAVATSSEYRVDTSGAAATKTADVSTVSMMKAGGEPIAPLEWAYIPIPKYETVCDLMKDKRTENAIQALSKSIGEQPAGAPEIL